MRARRLVLALLLASPSALGAQVADPEVVDLTFQGNQSFTETALETAIVTRETECRSIVLQPLCLLGSDWAHDPYFLDRRTLVRDRARVQLFYYQRGYRDATIDTVLAYPSDDEVRITFRIQEGRPVRVDSLSIVGLESLPDSVEMPDRLSLGTGDPLSGILLDATRDTLQTRLRNQGYAHADVLRSYFVGRDDPYGATVEFDVYTGPPTIIGPLTVIGNSTVSDQVVRRMLPMEPGDPYRQSAIFEAQRNLYNLEIFTHAEIRPILENQPDSVVPLRVQVNEGDAHRVRAGAGWNNADCFNAESRWASRNFLGGARRLQLRGRISNVMARDLNQSICDQSGSGEFGRLNGLLSADFTQPWVFSARNSLTLGLYVERQSLKDIFVREAVGGQAVATRTLGLRQVLTLGYEPQLSSLDAAEIFFCTSFQVCAPGDIGVLSGANWLSPLSASYSQDRSDQVLNPTRGYSFRLEAEHASGLTGSDFAYHRLLGELNRYWSLAPGWVLAGRIRAGWMEPLDFGETLSDAGDLQIVHPQKRFFAGGSNSVRGYAQNQLGPRSLTVPLRFLLSDAVVEDPPCTPEEVLLLTCDAGGLAENGELLDEHFTPRPTGGSQLLEGNAELRFPLAGPQTEGVVFLDYGYVWPDPGRIALSDLKLTPGIGFRYFTPIGPLRVDLGYQLDAGDHLRVVTSQVRPYDRSRDDAGDRLRGPDGTVLDWVSTEELALLRPTVFYDDAEPWSLGRLQLHFSLGQAF